MAIKILTLSEKNNLSMEERLSYENKLRNEVKRREARFEENDKFFRKHSLKYQETIYERNENEKFPIRRTGATYDINLGIRVLEDVIQNKQSTKIGRKESLNLSFATFNANIVNSGGKKISRTKYNRIAKFFDKLDDNEDINEYFYDSWEVVEAVNEGIDFDNFAKTLVLIEDINNEKKYGMPHYSLDMIKEVYTEYYVKNNSKERKDKTIEKIFEKYVRRTSESNE